MLKHSSKKSGYTLIEVLVVVSIMGVLSTMGVVSLRGAVINTRMKDSALNVTAFLERIANEANRLSKKICVVKDNDQRLSAYVADKCSDLSGADIVDSYLLDAPAKFGGCGGKIDDFGGSEWANGALFEPRIGLSAAPSEGFVCMRYGNSDTYGMAVKEKDKNKIYPMLGYEEDGIIRFHEL